MLLIISFATMCCFPFHICYLKGRLEVLKTIYNILISPFGKVKFRHFFLADIITSMAHVLQDTGTIGCFLASGNVLTSTKVTDLKEECSAMFYWKIYVSFLPYWWRFAQCLHKYHDSKMKVNLLNAAKYSTSLLVALASIWVVKSTDESSITKKEVNLAWWLYLAIKVI